MTETNARLKGPRLTLVLVLIWFGVFGAIFLFGPIASFVNDKIYMFAVSFGVDHRLIYAAIFISVYISLVAIVLTNPVRRAAWSSFFASILKTEKPFYAKVSSLGAEVTFGRPTASSAAGLNMNEILDKRVSILESKLDEVAATGLNSSKVELAEEELIEIRRRAVDDVIRDLSEVLRSDVQEALIREKTSNLVNASLARLSGQIEVLGSRATFALWSGLSFCSLGLLVLIWGFVFSGSEVKVPISEDHYWGSIFMELAPRLSIVLIIESIGVFFQSSIDLRLKRFGLPRMRLPI